MMLSKLGKPGKEENIEAKHDPYRKGAAID
jgi:hypothetical protein